MTIQNKPVCPADLNFAAMRALCERPIDKGSLYVVSTPIGNLADISLRALNILSQVDIIACEDTRVTKKLLHYFSITTKTLSYHDHNAHKQVDVIIRLLDKGETVALVSDAGTPLICDPGYRLINKAHEKGYKVIPIPGPSAPLAALSAAGLANDAFVFAGFLPAKSSARRSFLQKWSHLDATLIVFDSPKRIAASLRDAVDVLGGRRHAVIARELTKRYETFYQSTLADLAVQFAEATPPKGEIVLLIEGTKAPPLSLDAVEEQLERRLQIMGVKDAADQLSDETGLSKRALYQRALTLKNKTLKDKKS